MGTTGTFNTMMIDSTRMITAAALAIALVACVTDLRSRRIPNVLTFSGAAAAMLMHAWFDGGSGLLEAVSGFGVGLLLFMPFFLLGGMGAGDVKLLAALGAWLGPADALALAICTSIIGGALAVVLALSRGYLLTAVRNIGRLLSFWRAAGLRPMPALTLESSKSPRLAFAVPMLMGTVVTLWLR